MFRSTRTGTVFVTASNSDERSRTETDFLCDGTADDAEIQAAVDSLPSGGGMVVLSEGTFTLEATISRSIDNITIMGMGMGTRLVNDASTVLISDGAQAGWAFLEFDVDAGDLTDSGTGVVSDYWLDGTRQGGGGGGAVNISGTPVNDQLAIWTNATTIEGDSGLTYDGTTLTLAAGISVGANINMNLNEIINFKAENLGALPGAGTTGRLIYLTTDNHLYLDQG